jgi:hypothetical protein
VWVQPAFSDLSGAATDGQVPNTITIDLATVATTATLGDSFVSFFPAFTSANLAGELSNETGSGLAVFGTSPTFAAAPTFSDMTAGSVAFFGTAGLASQDNANFFWNDTDNRLGIGGGTNDRRLYVFDSTTATSGGHVSSFLQFNADPSGSTTGAHSGATCSGGVTAGNAQNFTNTTAGLTGCEGQAAHRGTGTVTVAAGVTGRVFVTNAAGTATTAAAFRALNPSLTGAASTVVGLDVEAMSGGATDNLAIRTGATGEVRVGVLTASRLVTSDADKDLASTITSANTAASVSDESGSGALLFGTAPTIDTPVLSNFTNAAHDHGDADDAGALAASTVGTSQITDGTVASADLATANKTFQFGWLVGADNGAVLVDGDDQPDFYVNRSRAITITEVYCIHDAGTAPIINLQRDDGTAANILSANLTCSTSGATGTIDAAEDNVAVGDKVDFVMVTAGGAAKRVSITVKYTVD